MWRIEAVTGGRPEGIEFREADLVTTGAQPVHFLTNSVGARGEWIEKLEKAIPTWLNREDVETSDGFLKSIEVDTNRGTVACKAQWPDPDSHAEYPGAVWLDESFVLIRKPDDVLSIELEYTTSDDDHRRTTKLENSLGGPSTAALEWFATFGDQTLVASGEVQFEGLGRVKRAKIYLAETAGWIFGRVVRYRINELSRRQTDPLYERRLKSLEGRRSQLAKDVPNIRDHPSIQKKTSSTGTKAADVKELVVLVHGTFSCAMRMLAAMNDQGLTHSNNNSWVRYEHDTFLPIGDNAEELADFVPKILHEPRQSKVIFVCHSRGGLVAVEAAKRLIQPKPNYTSFPASSVEVVTYGTPHAGTPLAAGAEAVSLVLRSMARASSRMAFSSLGLDPVGWALGWAIGRPNFPRGIAAMNPDSDFIHTYSSATYPFHVTGVGGFINLSSGEDGFLSVTKASALHDIMRGQRHDGIVQLDSSLKKCEPLCPPAEQCGHSDYFSRGDTLTPLRRRLEFGHWI